MKLVVLQHLTKGGSYVESLSFQMGQLSPIGR